MDINNYLQNLRAKLVEPANWHPIVMTRQWTSTIPNTPGVYILRESDQTVYVGETGNLRGRMNDLLDSRHHTVRRTIGKTLFSSTDGFTQATAKSKFPEHIELLLNEHICKNLLVAYLPVQIGRKELEELIEKEMCHETKLNKRGRRK
jgi:hypothetical protein